MFLLRKNVIKFEGRENLVNLTVTMTKNSPFVLSWARPGVALSLLPSELLFSGLFGRWFSLSDPSEVKNRYGHYVVLLKQSFCYTFFSLNICDVQGFPVNTIDWKSSHQKLWEWPYLRLRLILRNPPTGVSRVLQSRLRVWCPWTRAVTRVPREVQEYWKWSFPAPRWGPGESAASEPWSAAVAAEGWTREERNR